MENLIGFYIVVLLHYCVGIFNMIYPYIFSKRWDKFFLLYIILLYSHWYFCGECILSYFEKIFYYGKDKYFIGQDPEHHLFIEHVFGKFGVNLTANIVFTIVTFLSCLAISIVILRSEWIHKTIKYILIYIIFIYNMYFVICKFLRK